MKQITLSFLLIILIASCGQKRANNDLYDMAAYEEEMPAITRQQPSIPPQPIEKVEKTEVDKKKIIKDGRIEIQVSEIEKLKIRIDTLVSKYGGYYGNESFSNTDYSSTFNLKIRIPAINFEKFISEIESGDGKVLFKEIDARDVTDEFIDLETRLENKRNYLKRYNDLLKQAKTIKEILEIEEKIRGLEEEIESAVGRLKYLSDQVDYSTLNLVLTKKKDFKYAPDIRDKFSEQLKHSLSKGWYGFVDFLLFIIKLWPFLIIAILILYFWRKYRKKKATKRDK